MSLALGLLFDPCKAFVFTYGMACGFQFSGLSFSQNIFSTAHGRCSIFVGGGNTHQLGLALITAAEMEISKAFVKHNAPDKDLP